MGNLLSPNFALPYLLAISYISYNLQKKVFLFLYIYIYIYTFILLGHSQLRGGGGGGGGGSYLDKRIK